MGVRASVEGGGSGGLIVGDRNEDTVRQDACYCAVVALVNADFGIVLIATFSLVEVCVPRRTVILVEAPAPSTFPISYTSSIRSDG